MMSNRIGKLRGVLLASLVVLGSGTNLRADDTEIYQTTYNPEITQRPKVLIAIDDSGSMNFTVPGQRPKYDPAATYANVHGSGRIYWSTNGTPPAENSSQYFQANKNRCAESFTSLTNLGISPTTKARRWKNQVSGTPSCVKVCPASHPFPRTHATRCYKTATGQNNNWVNGTQNCTTPITPGTWLPLSTSAQSPLHVECQVDVTNSNNGNGSGQPTGYAKDNVLDSQALSAATPADSNVSNWGSETENYTFYTSHYMDWFYDDSLIVDRTRMEIAQEVITNMVSANKGFDFGLMEFNGNWSNKPYHGGRVVHRIVANMTEEQRENVVDMVNTMTSGGSTPLCEATYEAYRYLAGETVLFGTKDDGNDYPAGNPDGDILPRDTLAESPLGTYQSPATDCAYTYIVLMTDGLPQNDTDANAAVEALTGKTCKDYPQDRTNPATIKNCLPELTEYMANTDLDGDTTNGNQYGITYTIGFTTDQKLLSDAAAKGKGQYFTAENADELTAAFQGAFLSILSTDTTFTSPAVAVDTFSRTESRDAVFYAMFKPEDRIDWNGNIKKLKIEIDDGNALLVDANGDPAIDTENGFIKDSAVTFWSGTADGGAVEKGGVGQLLANRDPATRNIYSNTGTAGALQAFNSTNMTYTAFGLNDQTQVFTAFSVPDQAQLDTLLAWARGYDVYDEDGDNATNETRPWVLADILHSQPLVVNYGALGSFTEENPDLRLLVGTNGGFVHMFGNDNGEEDWAFFPKELAPVLRKRALNALSSQHVYGVDNTAVLYTNDVGKDGTLDAGDGDKAYVYLTLRRGGEALYALDVSNPDSPSFMWMIDSTSSGFSELGQTWSRPVVTVIPGYTDDSDPPKPKPVLIFGAGYDPNKDATGVATPDSQGRGIFIVDAATGTLIWSLTPAANSAKNKNESGLLHSVAAGVTPLDSNGDGLTDRIYFADTGGNLWRVDLPGNALPTSSQNTWHVVKMAAMNGGTELTDRRFFNAPDVVRTSYDGGSFDAIAIGTGDRTNPNSTDVLDQFYMIRDQQVAPYFNEFDENEDCDNDEDTVDDFRCMLELGVNSLYDATLNTIQTGEEEEDRVAAFDALQAAAGWRIDLNASGEKSLAKSLTLDGKIYFTTFSPEVENDRICEPVPGTGRLYVVNLMNATPALDFDGDGDYERSWTIGSLIPDTPSPHFGEDGEIRLLFPPGSGDGVVANPLETGVSLPDPYGAWWYREEY
jgi:type IV pilus assembly protein PilY1